MMVYGWEIVKDFRPERNIMENYILHEKYPKEFSKPDEANLKTEGKEFCTIRRKLMRKRCIYIYI